MNQCPGTRESLVEVGRRLFAERGFKGTSVRAITDAAHVNLGAITYHFGSKEAFYHEVVASALTGIFEGVAAGTEATSPLDKLEAFVRALFAGLRRFPEVGPILLRELSMPGEVPPPVAARIKQVNSFLTEAVAQGQRDGSIVEGDPQLLTLSILAQPFHLMAVRLKMQYTIGLPAQDPAVFDRLVENATAFIRRGLSRHA